jgi:hypothetical protein
LIDESTRVSSYEIKLEAFRGLIAWAEMFRAGLKQIADLRSRDVVIFNNYRNLVSAVAAARGKHQVGATGGMSVPEIDAGIRNLKSSVQAYWDCIVSVPLELLRTDMERVRGLRGLGLDEDKCRRAIGDLESERSGHGEAPGADASGDGSVESLIDNRRTTVLAAFECIDGLVGNMERFEADARYNGAVSELINYGRRLGRYAEESGILLSRVAELRTRVNILELDSEKRGGDTNAVGVTCVDYIRRCDELTIRVNDYVDRCESVSSGLRGLEELRSMSVEDLESMGRSCMETEGEITVAGGQILSEFENLSAQFNAFDSEDLRKESSAAVSVASGWYRALDDNVRSASGFGEAYASLSSLNVTIKGNADPSSVDKLREKLGVRKAALRAIWDTLVSSGSASSGSGDASVGTSGGEGGSYSGSAAPGSGPVGLILGRVGVSGGLDSGYDTLSTDLVALREARVALLASPFLAHDFFECVVGLARGGEVKRGVDDLKEWCGGLPVVDVLCYVVECDICYMKKCDELYTKNHSYIDSRNKNSSSAPSQHLLGAALSGAMGNWGMFASDRLREDYANLRVSDTGLTDEATWGGFASGPLRRLCKAYVDVFREYLKLFYGMWNTPLASYLVENRALNKGVATAEMYGKCVTDYNLLAGVTTAVGKRSIGSRASSADRGSPAHGDFLDALAEYEATISSHLTWVQSVTALKTTVGRIHAVYSGRDAVREAAGDVSIPSVEKMFAWKRSGVNKDPYVRRVTGTPDVLNSSGAAGPPAAASPRRTATDRPAAPASPRVAGTGPAGPVPAGPRRQTNKKK